MDSASVPSGARDHQPESTSQDQEPSFEDAYARLGETVHALESGELTLQSATDLYEEGMRLVQLCNRLLSKAELRMTELRDARTADAPDEPLFPEEQ